MWKSSKWCWLWPCGPAQIYCLFCLFYARLPNLPVRVPVSAAWAVYYPSPRALLSTMLPCCCWLSGHRKRRFFSRSKAFLAVTVSGIMEGKAPTVWASIRLQHDSETSHWVRRSAALCVWRNVWLLEVCLPGSHQCSQRWLKCVFGCCCCWTEASSSHQPLMGSQTASCRGNLWPASLWGLHSSRISLKNISVRRLANLSAFPWQEVCSFCLLLKVALWKVSPWCHVKAAGHLLWFAWDHTAIIHDCPLTEIECIIVSFKHILKINQHISKCRCCCVSHLVRKEKLMMRFL